MDQQEPQIVNTESVSLNTEEVKTNPKKSIIKHIVCSGGGEYGFAYYGALRESNLSNLWKIEDIVSMHGTSIGSVFIVFACLAHKLDWDTMDAYMYNRPWNNICDFSIENVLNSYLKLGLMNIKIVEETLKPVLYACDLSLDITLKEWYEYTGIDCHIYTTCLETLDVINLSWKTHPDWKLTEAIYASACLPILFIPFEKEGKIYIDGGTRCNYPLTYCLEIAENPDEVLGLKKTSIPPNQSDTGASKYSNLFDYTLGIMEKIMLKVSIKPPKIKHEIEFPATTTNIYNIYMSVSDYENRKKLIEYGVECWKKSGLDVNV
jgi:predicted acylesterase/phospholipase RssA